MKNILALCCVLTMLVGCKKEQVPAAHSKQVILPCSQSNNWTKESMGKALQGNWLLYRVETEDGQQTVPYKRLTFTSGDLLVWDMPDASVVHGKYTVEQSGSHLTIQAEDKVASIVSGDLYLCGDYMIFSSNAVDGTDRYYQRN